MFRALSIAGLLALADPSTAEAIAWSGNEAGTYVTAALPDGRSTVFSVRCEPSASGGRTIPIFFIRLPADRVSFSGLHAQSTAEMRLEIAGDSSSGGTASFALDTTTFEIEGGDGRASVVFQGYGGSDVSEPTAQAILSLLAQSSRLVVLARIDQGPWVLQPIPVEGARAALKKTWCGDGSN